MSGYMTDRRGFLKAMGMGAAAFAAPRLARAAAPPKRPNILIILSDDMGFSDLGCYGGEIDTPNLDRLAAGGVRFTQFCNTARCCPTRASLLTGLYPHQAAIGHMMEDKKLEGYQGDLSHRAVTIAEALQPAGYARYMVGKWHVTRFAGENGPKENWPLQRGFERYYGIIGGAANYFSPNTLTRDNTRITAPDDTEYRPDEYYLTDAISEHAVRFIDDHHRKSPDQPFFLYSAFTAAHWPLHAPADAVAPYRGRYDGGYEPARLRRFERLREMGLIRREWELSPQAQQWDAVPDKKWESRCMEVYAAQVSRMDQGIGRIVETLRRNGQLDDTLIFFLQDNGGCAENICRNPDAQGRFPDPGPGDTWLSYREGWANVSNTPFRYYKHFVHEGGISTPLIAHWPAGIARRGELEHQPGHLIDLMATCVDVSGATYPKERDGQPITPAEGRSLVPAFSGKTIQREGIYWEHEGNRAVRSGKYKLVARGATGPWELYDMEADRTELHDLAAEQPERVKAMAAQWDAWAKRAHALPWPWTGAAAAAAAADVGSKATSFDLKPGDELAREDSPRVAKRAFTITASLAASGEGVIVAQGGTSLGWSLYVKDGKLEMMVRRRGNQTVVTAPEKLPAGAVDVGASLAKNGAVSLRVAGKEVATAKAPGAIQDMPLDGLQVGHDLAGQVGRYENEGRFAGRIEKVHIELDRP